MKQRLKSHYQITHIGICLCKYEIPCKKYCKAQPRNGISARTKYSEQDDEEHEEKEHVYDWLETLEELPQNPEIET